MAVFNFGDAVKAQGAEGEAKGRKRKGRKSRKGLSIVIMIIAVAICLLVMLVGFITDWMWFKDLGYTSVFWKKLVTELEIGIPTFLIVTLLARFYLRTLKKGYFKKIESHEIPNERKINARSWLISIVFGVLMGLYASTGTWLTYLKSANATNFGLKDPLFNLDIGFYIFNLDWYDRLNQIVLVGIIGLVIVTVLYYTYLLGVRTPDIFVHDEEEPPQPEEFVEPEEDVDPWVLKEEGKDIPFDQSLMGKLFKKGKKVVQDNVDENGRLKRRKKPEVNNSNLEQLLEIASGKLTVLGIIFYLMLGVDFFLRQFDLLHTHTGAVYGAGFVDVNITLWVYRIIMVLCVVGAVTLAMHIRKSEIRKLIRVPAIMILVYILGVGAGSLVQALIVSPDEINKEAKYLENNIEYTRHAYGVDDVRVAPYAADDSLTADAINNNDETIGNIRINDYGPVEDFYNQTQSIRQYYRFNDVDIDRYDIGGQITQNRDASPRSSSSLMIMPVSIVLPTPTSSATSKRTVDCFSASMSGANW